MRNAPIVVSLLLLSTFPAAAQTKDLERLQDRHRKQILAALDLLSNADLQYRPSPEVRTTRDLLAHIADGAFAICGPALDRKPEPGYEKMTLGTEGLKKALAESFDYCAPVFSMSTPEAARAQSLAVYHAGQHYGNLVTYMRLRGIKPPGADGSKPAAATPVMEKYYFGFLKRGKAWTPERSAETAKIQEGHMAHLNKMAESGKLVVAGPFADNGDVRGILIFKGSAGSLEEIKALAEQDPAVRAGRLEVELRPWLTQKGILPE